MTEQILERPAHAGQESADFTVAPAASSEAIVAPVTAWNNSSDGEDFDYIPVSPWAPIALVLGLLSLTGFLGIFGLYVAFFGIFVGIAAVFRIRSSEGLSKGTWMAVTGLVLSVASLGLGSAKMAHAYSTEVPEGFLRVNFPRDIAEKQFIYIGGNRKLHPSVVPLMGQKVYLKGFMWVTQDYEGLAQFILLKDNGECCFGGKPKSHDYIFVKLRGFDTPEERPPLSLRSSALEVRKLTDEEKEKLKLTHNYQLTTPSFIGMVAVAGVIQADVKAGEKGPPDEYDLAPVYTMDAELVEDAWTRF